MKNKLFFLMFLTLSVLNSCKETPTAQNTNPVNQEVNSTSEVPKQDPAVTTEIEKSQPVEAEKPAELPWNFKGTIGNIPIKAQLIFAEATNNEYTGAIIFPISGYYYYESQNIKIPLSGEANGVGILWLQAGDETFSGEVVGDALLENFAGTWSKGKKTMKFVLNSK